MHRSSRIHGSIPSRRGIASVFAGLSIAIAVASPALGAGARWTAVGPGGGRVFSLVTAPSDARVLYGVGDGPSIFRSTNGGGSWELRAAGLSLPRFAPAAPAVDPEDPNHLFAAALDPSTGDFSAGGVYESADGGATWTPASDGLGRSSPRPFVYQLAFDPRDPGALYAATGAGIFVLRPGHAWSPFALDGATVFALAFDPAAPHTFLATVSFPASAERGILKSTDGGATWAQKSAAMPTVQLAYDAGDPRRVAGTDGGGLFHSVDGGETWVTRAIPASAYAFVFGDGPTTLYLATNRGVYRSADAGDHWSAFVNRPQDTLFALLTVHGATETLLAAGNRGLWRSTDGAESWAPASFGVAVHSPVTLTAAMDTAGTVYFSDLGIFRSADHGASWRSVNQGLAASTGFNPPPLPTPRLAVAPSNPQMLYAGTETGVVRSLDGGDHWRAVRQPVPLGRLLTDVVVDPTSPRTVYVTGLAINGQDDSCHSWKSTDAADHWRCLGIDALALAVHPVQPEVVAAIYGTVLRSSDGGSTWSPGGRPADGSGLLSLAFDPVNPNVLYLGTTGGAYASRDRGLSLFRLGKGLPAGAWVESITVDPTNPAVLYAGVVHPLPGGDLQGVGAYRSTDRGAHWQRLGDRLPPEFDGHLTLDAGNRLLYAATSARGLYRLDLSRL
jgi:photosystem II stability/assembly factor-like uncharacterized protein